MSKRKKRKAYLNRYLRMASGVALAGFGLAAMNYGIKNMKG